MKITIDELKTALIDGLNLEDLTPEELNENMALFGEDGLGLDSVDSIELVLMVEREFGVKINDSKEYNQIFSSLGNLLSYINEKRV